MPNNQILISQKTFEDLLALIGSSELAAAAKAEAVIVIPGLVWTADHLKDEVIAQGITTDETEASRIAHRLLEDQDYSNADYTTSAITEEIAGIVSEYVPTRAVQTIPVSAGCQVANPTECPIKAMCISKSGESTCEYYDSIQGDIVQCTYL